MRHSSCYLSSRRCLWWWRGRVFCRKSGTGATLQAWAWTGTGPNLSWESKRLLNLKSLFKIQNGELIQRLEDRCLQDVVLGSDLSASPFQRLSVFTFRSISFFQSIPWDVTVSKSMTMKFRLTSEITLSHSLLTSSAAQSERASRKESTFSATWSRPWGYSCTGFESQYLCVLFSNRIRTGHLLWQ